MAALPVPVDGADALNCSATATATLLNLTRHVGGKACHECVPILHFSDWLRSVSLAAPCAHRRARARSLAATAEWRRGGHAYRYHIYTVQSQCAIVGGTLRHAAATHRQQPNRPRGSRRAVLKLCRARVRRRTSWYHCSCSALHSPGLSCLPPLLFHPSRLSAAPPQQQPPRRHVPAPRPPTVLLPCSRRHPALTVRTSTASLRTALLTTLSRRSSWTCRGRSAARAAHAVWRPHSPCPVRRAPPSGRAPLGFPRGQRPTG